MPRKTARLCIFIPDEGTEAFGERADRTTLFLYGAFLNIGIAVCSNNKGADAANGSTGSVCPASSCQQKIWTAWLRIRTGMPGCLLSEAIKRGAGCSLFLCPSPCAKVELHTCRLHQKCTKSRIADSAFRRHSAFFCKASARA